MPKEPRISYLRATLPILIAACAAEVCVIKCMRLGSFDVNPCTVEPALVQQKRRRGYLNKEWRQLMVNAIPRATLSW